MQLCEMAQEYRANTALLELRIKQLQLAQRRTRQKEVKLRLKQRINRLRTLINESRLTAFELEHYYDKGGEASAHHRAV